ncbi:hypothetical protein [Streptomyces sp. H34-S4]|uniref:hypothetical protein n=1 Tax=Streptomyces sp. H34-S4 TaxID=2996463 RepID=UPI002270037A|nr:hypothetical protein [Streptomyces sp. H34-S4]MCY0937549.1 hypothetical protein [Streptomyces sp. H34-S4]
MKRIARRLSLACMTALVMIPTAGVAAAAPAASQIRVYEDDDCDHGRYDGYQNQGRWHNGHYYGGGLGLGLIL